MKRDIDPAIKFTLAIFVLLLVLSIGAYSKASCDVPWHPGDIIFVDAGHTINVIVDSDDLAAFEKNKVPNKYLPIPTEENLQKLLDQGQHTWACGDFREVTDDDL